MGDFFLLDLERRLEPLVLHFVNAPKPWEIRQLAGRRAFRRGLSRLVRRLALAGMGEGAGDAAVAADPPAAHAPQASFAERLAAFIDETPFLDRRVVRVRLTARGGGRLELRRCCLTAAPFQRPSAASQDAQAHMFRTLMTSRRFAPLFWCQFFSAFNDNFVRNMLAMLILFRFGGERSSLKILIATMIFVLPAIPLSALGGEIADAHDKALVARRLKLAEIFVQMIAAAGFVLSSLTLLYVALFGLGCVAALFGPIKYGILPDHLRREELVSGNALVEGATFAAIICGLVVGGFAAAEGRSPLSVVAQLMVVAFACYAHGALHSADRRRRAGTQGRPQRLRFDLAGHQRGARRRSPVGRGARH